MSYFIKPAPKWRSRRCYNRLFRALLKGKLPLDHMTVDAVEVPDISKAMDEIYSHSMTRDTPTNRTLGLMTGRKAVGLILLVLFMGQFLSSGADARQRRHHHRQHHHVVHKEVKRVVPNPKPRPVVAGLPDCTDLSGNPFLSLVAWDAPKDEVPYVTPWANSIELTAWDVIMMVAMQSEWPNDPMKIVIRNLEIRSLKLEAENRLAASMPVVYHKEFELPTVVGILLIISGSLFCVAAGWKYAEYLNGEFDFARLQWYALKQWREFWKGKNIWPIQ